MFIIDQQIMQIIFDDYLLQSFLIFFISIFVISFGLTKRFYSTNPLLTFMLPFLFISNIVIHLSLLYQIQLLFLFLLLFSKSNYY